MAGSPFTVCGSTYIYSVLCQDLPFRFQLKLDSLYPTTDSIWFNFNRWRVPFSATLQVEPKPTPTWPMGTPSWVCVNLHFPVFALVHALWFGDVHVFFFLWVWCSCSFILGLLFDSGFDVVAVFIFWFKKNIEEQVLMFLDLTSCNFLFLIFLFN